MEAPTVGDEDAPVADQPACCTQFGIVLHCEEVAAWLAFTEDRRSETRRGERMVRFAACSDELRPYPTNRTSDGSDETISIDVVQCPRCVVELSGRSLEIGREASDFVEGNRAASDRQPPGVCTRGDAFACPGQADTDLAQSPSG